MNTASTQSARKTGRKAGSRPSAGAGAFTSGFRPSLGATGGLPARAPPREPALAGKLPVAPGAVLTPGAVVKPLRNGGGVISRRVTGRRLILLVLFVISANTEISSAMGEAVFRRLPALRFYVSLSSFCTRAPSFMNLTSAALGRRRICSYQPVVA